MLIQLNLIKFEISNKKFQLRCQFVEHFHDSHHSLQKDTSQSNLNRDVVKLLREIDYIKHQLGEFDASRHNIVVWFKRFEGLSDMLGWSNEQRVDALPHLLGPAFDRLACQAEPKYELIKNDTLNLVSKLLIQGTLTRMFDHLVQVVIPIFDEKEFTNAEKRYWLACIASPTYYKNLCGKLQGVGMDLKVARLLERCFD